MGSLLNNKIRSLRAHNIMNDEKLPKRFAEQNRSHENDAKDVKNDNDKSKETKASEINEVALKDENERLKDENEKLDSENQKLNAGHESLKNQLAEKTSKCDEYLDMLQRTIAEYDNFKKRTQREKDAIGKDVTCDIITAFIPVIDNLERALDATEKDCNYRTIKDGVEMVYRQLRDILERLGVEEIYPLGEKFDPKFHNAVMHVEDDGHEENEIIEVFQKGYVLNDKVIRHSVVRVAN